MFKYNMCKNQRGLDDKSLDALVEKYGKDKLLESMTEEERAEFEKMYQRVLCSDNYRGLKYMLERGCPVDMEFREAYGGMKFEVGEYLKETRIATITGSMTDPPFNPITPLAIVSICSEMDKEPKLLKLLIEYGLDLRKCKKSEYGEVSRERYRGVKNASALYCATVRCNTELVTMLLENGHPPEDELLYVLSTRRYLAHTPREKEILSLLIKHGCDVNARKGENGNTLAHMALALWFCYVEGLLKNCDDLDEGPFGGVQLTAKQWIFLNLEKMFLTNYIEFLGNHGFDFNGKNDRQQTLLHIFFKNVRMLKEIFPRPFLVVGHIIKDLLPMIVDKVDDVNTVDSDGKTVLDEFITGARKDLLVVYKPTNFEWLKTLIMKGACFSPIDYYDLIMAMSSLYYRHIDTVGFIVNSFANWNSTMFLIHCEAAVTNYVIKQQKYHWDLATPDDLLAALDSYILLCNKVCQMRRIPRTLQHQCRHALRVMLGKKYVDAIEKFTLSRQLKNFLLFTDPQQVDFSEAVED